MGFKQAYLKQPLLLFHPFPADGHLGPPFSIAAHLKSKGYDVAFLTTEEFKPKVEGIGAEWLHLDSPFTPECMQGLMSLGGKPHDIETLTLAHKYVFNLTLPYRAQRLEEVLAMLHARDPNRQIICIEDVFNFSVMPFKYGRKLPVGLAETTKFIGIGGAPVMANSQDTAPSMLCLPPDSTPSGRLRNKALAKLFWDGPLKALRENFVGAIEAAGATETSRLQDKDLFTSWYTVYDAVLQLCSPSMEYPRSDLPSTIEYAGVPVGQPLDPNLKYPEWWPEVTSARANGVRVVFVTQGTVNLDLTELIAPTLQATAGRDDLLVVVLLATRGAKIPETISVPSNARVIDYFPYDAVLEYADVFVSNGGYGSFCHGVRNGVPMVVAGQAQDKPEVSMRVAFSGMGVNLATQNPTVEQVRDGIEQVLEKPEFKNAALKLQEENAKMDAYSACERRVEALTI